MAFKYVYNDVTFNNFYEIRNLFPSVSFPANPVQADLTPFGVTVLGSLEPDIEDVRSSKLTLITALLTESDYKCHKFVDGDLSVEEYAETKTLRHNLRVAYNAVEGASTIEAINAVSW